MTCVLLTGVCGGFRVLFSSTAVRPELTTWSCSRLGPPSDGVLTGQKMSHTSESLAVV